MKAYSVIKINFRGGIISPGQLYNILVEVSKAGVRYVSFGLRQQLLIEVYNTGSDSLFTMLEQAGAKPVRGDDGPPNICSSFPAAGVFIKNSWLTEGVYRDLFDAFDYEPGVKINICDSNQSFTPMLTGNINWVASAEAPHFWHLFIRYPKTNQIMEWDHCIYSNDLCHASKLIEKWMLSDNKNADGELLWHELFTKLLNQPYIFSRAEGNFRFPLFNVPYYEGLNTYHEKLWLGIYRRDELFAVDFLKEMCRICLRTRIGQICCTSWKSLIVKNIEPEHRLQWSDLLAKHHVNVRHAGNELNFQVEDNCPNGVALKQYLVKHLNDDDIRTFGIAIGIRMRRKSEVFSNILIRQRCLVRLFGLRLLPVYDILCSRDFNPNERTAFIFSKNNFRWLLPEQLRRAILSFYAFQQNSKVIPGPVERPVMDLAPVIFRMYKCKHCASVYDEKIGMPEAGIAAGTSWSALHPGFTCELCDASKNDFEEADVSVLNRVSQDPAGS